MSILFLFFLLINFVLNMSNKDKRNISKKVIKRNEINVSHVCFLAYSDTFTQTGHIFSFDIKRLVCVPM
jgi:hypothetical protein